MTLRALLDRLSRAGVGLVATGGDLHAYGPPGAGLSAEVRAAISAHKVALIVAIDPAALRARWRLPTSQPLPGALAVILAWLTLEFDVTASRYTTADRCQQLDHYMRLVDEGWPPYVADVLAIEAIVTAKRAAARPTARKAAA